MKYGRACPHGGHYGGKRRSSLTHVLPATTATSATHVPHHRAEKRSTADARADA
ncbi:hypothetical protein [Nocardioides sp. MH1]|uniref:hypothetical protein n=1 Tax=Nocardioides sp. MH1 TaxID=3242490 RepID=UPI0035225AFD